MCDGIEFRRPDGSTQCIPIYYEIDPWRRHPDPERERWYDDLVSLVTIDRIARQIQDGEVKAQVSKAVQTAAQAVAQALPEGLSLGDELFGSERMATVR